MIETDRELAQLAAEAPDIPGLQFRRLRLPDDLVPLSEMANRAAAADEIDERESPEDWDSWFSHPTGFDPMTAGMTSAVLGVDADNPTGALGVYEANGFVVQRKGLNYRRPLK